MQNLAFEFAPDGIIMTDLDGSIREANRAALRIHGYNAQQELTGRNLAELVGESGNETGSQVMIENLIKLTILDRSSPRAPIILKRKDGSGFPGEIRLGLIEQTGMQPAGLVATIKETSSTGDISGHFPENLTWLNKALCHGNIGIFVTDIASQQIQWSEGMYRLMERDPALGPPTHEEFKMYYLPEQIRLLQNRARQVIETNRSVSHETEVSLPSGRVKYFRTGVHPVTDRDGSVIKIIGIAHDITQDRYAENSFVLNERRTHKIIENSWDIVLVIGENGETLDVSDSVSRVLGYPRDEFIRKKLPALIYPGDWKTVKESWQEIMDYPDSGVTYEARIHHRDGTWHWMEVTMVNMLYEPSVRAIISNIRDITKRKDLEARLRFSDTAFNSIHDAVIALDLGYRVTFWNSSSEQMFGIKAGDIIGKPIGDFIQLVENYPGQNDQRMELLQTRGFNREEQIYRCPKGDVWVDVHSQSIEENGNRLGWVTLCADITDRKAMESALLDSEEKFSTVFYFNPNPLVIFEAKEPPIINDVNDAFERISGYSRAECIGKSIASLNLVPDKETDATIIRTLREAGRFKDIEAVVRSRTGEERTVLFDAERINLEGVPHQLVETIDITDLREAEEQVRRSVKEWETTFNSISDRIHIVDRSLTIIRANKAFADFNNMNPEDTIGKKCYELVHGLSTQCSDCGFKKAITAKAPVTGEFTEAATGRLFSSAMSPIMDDEGEVIACVHTAREITERKKMEEQIKQAQLLASLGKMTAGIAHEVNNPLGSILLYSELLMKGELPAQTKRDLKIIHSEAKRATKIMTALLNYQKGRSSQMRRLKLQKIINKVLDMRRYNESVQNINVYTNLPKQSLTVKGDMPGLTQVFMNILLNAEEALRTKNGGNIVITAQVENRWVKISVADDGPGIPEENLDMVFHPFFTTKDVGEGTGLGLSTCYSTVTAHNGLIHVENNDMGGATFSVELPLVDTNDEIKSPVQDSPPNKTAATPEKGEQGEGNG